MVPGQSFSHPVDYSVWDFLLTSAQQTSVCDLNKLKLSHIEALPNCQETTVNEDTVESEKQQEPVSVPNETQDVLDFCSASCFQVVCQRLSVFQMTPQCIVMNQQSLISLQKKLLAMAAQNVSKFHHEKIVFAVPKKIH